MDYTLPLHIGEGYEIQIYMSEMLVFSNKSDNFLPKNVQLECTFPNYSIHLLKIVV